MNAPMNEDSNSRGMILLVVLWATALMTVIVVALSSYAQKSASLADIEADRLRTQMALEAGIDVGEAMILARTAGDRIYLDGTPATADLGGNRLVAVALMDAAGLVDINRADGELLEGLAARLEPSGGALATLAEEIIKLREARKSKNPATQGLQQNEEKASGDDTAQPIAAEFFSTQQLYGLQGAEPEAVDSLLPFISLYSIDGKVNPMAAPGLVIQSIPGLKLAEADTLAAARKLRQGNSPAVQNILSQHLKFLATGEPKVFLISVTVVSGRDVIAGSRLQAIVTLNETASHPFQILAWSW